MTKPKTPRLEAFDACSQALETAIAKTQGKGCMTDIADKMTALSGSPVTRQMVGRWLNPNPKKRVQPSLGAGLLLLWAIAILNDEARESVFDAEITIRMPHPSAVKAKTAAKPAKTQARRK